MDWDVLVKEGLFEEGEGSRTGMDDRGVWTIYLWLRGIEGGVPWCPLAWTALPVWRGRWCWAGDRCV